MKAMLLKDFYTLKEAKILIALMLFVAVIMDFLGRRGQYVVYHQLYYSDCSCFGFEHHCLR